MIVYDIKCGAGHVFEAWFAGQADFAAQKQRGLVACPLCDDTACEKLPAAPAISAKSGGSKAAFDAEKAKKLLGAMAAAESKALENSEYVGGNFAEEARAIHYGEADERSIHGEARLSEAQKLREEGIAATPLFFSRRARASDA